jgi:hypothetical protein
MYFIRVKSAIETGMESSDPSLFHQQFLSSLGVGLFLQHIQGIVNGEAGRFLPGRVVLKGA